MTEAQTSDMPPALATPEGAKTEFESFWERFEPYMGFAAPDHLSIVIGEDVPIPVQLDPEFQEKNKAELGSRIIQSVKLHPHQELCIIPEFIIKNEDVRPLIASIKLDNFLEWSQSLSLENRIKRKPLLEKSDVDKIKLLFDVSATIVGGMDNFDIAHKISGAVILDAIRKKDKPPVI